MSPGMKIYEAEEVKGLEPDVVTLAEAASGRYPCLTWGPNKASFWVVAECDSGYDLQLAGLSRFPHPYPEDYTPEKYPRLYPKHCVDIEMSDSGIEYFLGIDACYPDNGVEKLATWLMQEGIAPNQPFRVMVDARYVGHTSMEWMGTEWDLEVDWEIVDRQYVEPLDAAQRWQQWMDSFKEVV